MLQTVGGTHAHHSAFRTPVSTLHKGSTHSKHVGRRYQRPEGCNPTYRMNTLVGTIWSSHPSEPAYREGENEGTNEGTASKLPLDILVQGSDNHNDSRMIPEKARGHALIFKHCNFLSRVKRSALKYWSDFSRPRDASAQVVSRSRPEVVMGRVALFVCTLNNLFHELNK